MGKILKVVTLLGMMPRIETHALKSYAGELIV